MDRDGGCLCGATRYKVSGDPLRVLYCHCDDCKKQTGSPYSIVASFEKEQVTFRNIERLKTHETVGDSGNQVERIFCGQCGSPIYSKVKALKDVILIKAGSFDDMSWLSPSAELYTKDKVRCATIDSSVDSFIAARK
jgi:hypothetical protein